MQKQGLTPSDVRLYRRADGYAWVGEHFVGRFPDQATHYAETPESNDSRWRPGVPVFADVQFITLSPFYPSGRLGVSVEMRVSNPVCLYSNHPAFEGCKAWMPVSETKWSPIPLSDQARYVVLDEHTLGYMIPELPGQFGILAGSVLRGGHDPMQGTVLISPGRTKVRPATESDFSEYRVSLPSCFIPKRAA